MEWLLILMFLTGSGVNVEQVEFETQGHCLKAIEVIRETQPGMQITASCVKTRGAPPSISEMFNSRKVK